MSLQEKGVAIDAATWDSVSPIHREAVSLDSCSNGGSIRHGACAAGQHCFGFLWRFIYFLCLSLSMNACHLMTCTTRAWLQNASSAGSSSWPDLPLPVGEFRSVNMAVCLAPAATKLPFIQKCRYRDVPGNYHHGSVFLKISFVTNFPFFTKLFTVSNSAWWRN